MKITKKQFNWLWKDSSKESILNQYYYDYKKMVELAKTINEAIESIKNIKPLSLEETALKESIKQAYYESSYIKNCKESFDMVCHLEDFEIAVWNILDILKREE